MHFSRSTIINKIQYIKNNIKTIADYPKSGIQFRDITSLLINPEAYTASIEILVEHYQTIEINKIVAIEARGFLFGAPLALALGLAFIPVRKPDKLPGETISENYHLEYGCDQLQVHKDSIKPGDKVLVIDDILATGGTIEATIKLIRRLDGQVAHAAFIIELPVLGGKKRLISQAVECYSLVSFE
ncbi:adenine phosphoribosyltransferase [Candidatus Williamhamiltonella defendens]|uniref:adenine phosphoribosyltransferase n=1 Tax=Candidatus Williamhamiltonella defendens TaxID=138072 RepID=UPI00130E7732|nr:adenine phosphoribosyltransferase [Candidatus Hamiltonella defensa]